MATPRVSIVINELNRFVEQTMAALALQILANLVAAPSRGGTPVDTGWARANWVPNIGTPITNTAGLQPSSKGGSGGGSRRRGTSAEQTTGAAKLVTYKLGSGPIYITNNVPYIQKLNAGWSKQAAAGFIQAAVARGAKAIAARRRG